MRVNNRDNSEFINPYRQNKRSFTKYFPQFSNIDLNLSKNASDKQQAFLDNVSKASSIKYRQPSHQNLLKNKSRKNSQEQTSYFVISNKKRIDEFQNPQIFHLISKHIQVNQSKIKKPKTILSKRVESLFSQRLRNKAQSVQKIQKAPKITQFSRLTFYRNVSSVMKQYSSKKQKQDDLHSNSNLDINAVKKNVCKKSRLYKDNRSFVTYEIYFLKSRVGIDVQILAGALKQIKFRLIMNQMDTKTFNKRWKDRINQFIDKCLIINQIGISLKIGVFNFDVQQQKKQSSRIKNVQKVYLQNYQSFIKKQLNSKKKTTKVGKFTFSQDYQQESNDLNQQKYLQIRQIKLESNNNIQTQEIKQRQNVQKIQLDKDKQQQQSPQKDIKQNIEQN